MLSVEDVGRLHACVAGGGLAVFPTDTVYGICCDPSSERAAARLYELKGRPAAQASAVMFFTVEAAVAALELHDSERRALSALLPGPVTALLANRARRFAAACACDPGTIGVRVPRLTEPIAALGTLAIPLLQSSANLSGGPDARSLVELAKAVYDGVDLVLDGGELPGLPSSVLDLRELHEHGRWRTLRSGALSQEQALAALGRSR